MYIIKNGKSEAHILKTSDICALYSHGIMINQLVGNEIDGMVGNIYLRLKMNYSYEYAPLLGNQEYNSFSLSSDSIMYTGEVLGFSYTASLILGENAWFYDIKVKNVSGKIGKIDLVFIQDMGLASNWHILNSEAYNSQYIDHRAFETNLGFVLASRQNQGQQTGNPYVQHGCLQGAVSYATDGYDVYGLNYKFDNKIEALNSERLANRVYQYEFAMAALQSNMYELKPDAEESVVFYGVFEPDKPTAVKEPISDAVLTGLYSNALNKTRIFETIKTSDSELNVRDILAYREITQSEIDEIYLDRHNEEFGCDGKLHSFFTPANAHVVISEKERYTERAHGNIIITGRNDFIKEDVITATNFIFGVFATQIAVGNTTYNQFNGPLRNMLNIIKTSGIRGLVKIKGKYQLLAMPALFEMGYNYGKWLYKTDVGDITIIVYTAVDGAILRLQVYAGNPVDIIFTSDIITVSEFTRTKYPDLEFIVSLSDGAVSKFENKRMVWEFSNITEAALTIVGKLETSFDESLLNDFNKTTFEETTETYRKWLHEASACLKLSLETENSSLKCEVEAQNDILLWYAHNARIHYCSPHGLEQFNGAAWGTRDICQGPVEYFSAVGRFDVVRDILIRIYQKQYYEDGTWPQWAMFDKYYSVQSHESHGDVIVWPLKALTAYLYASGDYSLLEEKLPYTSKEKNNEPTDFTELLLNHVRKQIAYIYSEFIPGTALSRYGDGDWDDTLQPFDPTLRENMASGWTVALTYQVFNEFADVIREYDRTLALDLIETAQKIKEDFNKFLLPDDITAGFAIFADAGVAGRGVRYLLHPRDNDTGISYRLLPMTRGMISGLFTAGQKDTHLSLIREKMYHPDGVRLMDTTSRYFGGENKYFKRAETAANFGREIGLLYTHAQLRFVEAMAKINEAEEAWRGLNMVNPIIRRLKVKNAKPLQQNCFFSSSDGCFSNRYEAMEHFEKLRDGGVPVKTGWRIYSSGSGLYINRLINDILGIRYSRGDLVIDPVLAEDMSGLTAELVWNKKKLTIRYRKAYGKELTVYVDGKPVTCESLSQPYRRAGVLIQDFLIKDDSVLDVLY